MSSSKKTRTKKKEHSKLFPRVSRCYSSYSSYSGASTSPKTYYKPKNTRKPAKKTRVYDTPKNALIKKIVLGNASKPSKTLISLSLILPLIDKVTTFWGMSQGKHETNPLITGVSSFPMLLIVMTTVTYVSILYLIKARANRTLSFINCLYLGFIITNLGVIMFDL